MSLLSRPNTNSCNQDPHPVIIPASTFKSSDDDIGVFIIPYEVFITHIFIRLEDEDISSIMLTCKRFWHMSNDSSIWKRFIKEYIFDPYTPIPKPEDPMQFIKKVLKERLKSLPDSWSTKTKLISRLEQPITADVMRKMLHYTETILSDTTKVYKKLAKDAELEGPSEDQCKSLNNLEEWFTPNKNILRKIAKLYLGHRKLTSLPDTIGHLHNLEELDLSYNNLIYLSDGIKHLKKLKKFILRGNLFTFTPSSIRTLSKLKVLDLRNNQLLEIPIFGVQCLKALTKLQLEGNRFITDKPQDSCTLHRQIRRVIPKN